MTQGIENGTGTIANAVSGRNAAGFSATNDAFRWYFPPPATYSFAWTPSGSLNNATLYNPTATLGAPSTVYNVTVSDANGCTSASSVTLAEPVSAPGNTNSTANPVCPAQSFTLSMANPPVGASFQWQSSPNGTTWTNLAGQTNNTYTLTQSVAT